MFNAARIEQIGDAGRALRAARHAFVAEFIGESNILTGHARPGSGVVQGPSWVADVPAKATVPGSGEVSLVVRPEMLRIAPGRADADARNQLEGRIQEAIYLGGVRKYTVRVADGSLLECRVPRRGAESALDPGAEVMLSWTRTRSCSCPPRTGRTPRRPPDAGGRIPGVRGPLGRSLNAQELDSRPSGY